MWSPTQYSRFRSARTRPFFELLAQVDVPAAAQVADLGCGTGDLTHVLAERWPGAEVVGVDSSPEMVAAARAQPLREGVRAGRVRFEVADLAGFRSARPLDVLVSNAALHWVEGHLALLPALASQLAPGGVLAFQVPANFEAPSHLLVDAVRALPRFREALAGVKRGAAHPLEAYAAALRGAGLGQVEAWETSYLHVLPGEDAVLEWLLGTTLRPVLGALGAVGPGEADAFLAELRPRLREAYPPDPGGEGTPFRFLRRFVVGRRKG
jgi:trans-aconitate 2-methyltransferase